MMGTTKNEGLLLMGSLLSVPEKMEEFQSVVMTHSMRIFLSQTILYLKGTIGTNVSWPTRLGGLLLPKMKMVWEKVKRSWLGTLRRCISEGSRAKRYVSMHEKTLL